MNLELVKVAMALVELELAIQLAEEPLTQHTQLAEPVDLEVLELELVELLDQEVDTSLLEVTPQEVTLKAQALI